jgi:HTH-type transcriptional regulator/antitoxin HipB
MNQVPVKVSSAADVGALVKQRRKSQDLSQQDFASLAQTGNRFVCDLESGKGTVQFNKVMQVLDMLGLDVVIMERKA